MTTPTLPLPTIPDDTLRELLCAYFFARDDLYETEADAEVRAAHPESICTTSRQAVIDLADELVARFVPDTAARCALTGEDPATLAYTGPSQPRAGDLIAAIHPGTGRITGTVHAVTDHAAIVHWQYTNLPPITYPLTQIVPTACGWHIRRT
ncbi:hypothetical protein [Mycolicibacterium sp.]|uniref:hypothetical protein n=1 Tax=Mycolicibacterium sp. TaxID=2320850 RepID=UPI00355E3F07